MLLVFVVLGPFGRTTLAHGNEVWKEYSYLGGMDAIALGCLTALLLARRRVTQPVLWLAGSIGAAFLIFSLGFSLQAYRWGLGCNGLNMTMIAIGACLLIVVAEQTRWQGPRILKPMLALGRRSYEIYLTHMFVVFGLFDLFVRAGKPLGVVPVLFFAILAFSCLLGEVVARYFSEPLNHWLRERWQDGAESMGSAIDLRRDRIRV